MRPQTVWRGSTPPTTRSSVNANFEAQTLIHRASPNFDARPGEVDMLVLHYTGMQSAEAALARLCDRAAKVSSHYVVDEDGSVYALVAEPNRAWHAGVSFWRGVTGLN